MKKSNNKVGDLLKIFPKDIAQVIGQGKESIDCPLEYLVTAGLIVGGVSIGSSASVSPKNGWKEYTSLFGVLVGNPSMKKTPALKLMKIPLELIQERLFEQFRDDMASYKALSKKERCSVFEPYEQMVYTSDFTIEGLLKHLYNNQVGVSLIVDELSHSFNSLNAYKQGGGDRQYLLQLFSHSSIAITRKGEVSTFIKTPVVSILGGIQPEVLKGFFNNQYNDGLNERFIYASPEETFSTKYSRAEVEQETIERYISYIQAIFEKSYDKVTNGETDNYELSATAKELWIEWMEAQNPDKANISYLKKSHSICLRIALILEILNNPDRDLLEINEKSMEGAIRLSNFYIYSFLKTKELMNKSEAESKSDKLFEWMLDKAGQPKYERVLRNLTGIKIRQIITNGVAGIKNKHQAKEVLMALQDEGKGFLYPHEGSKYKNSAEPHIFCISPKYKKGIQD